MPERRAILTPFWSHDHSLEGYGHLHPEVILNVLVFIPIGVLLGCASDKMKWWKALLFGASFSILIEVVQYVTRRGFAEFDDVFHNTLGCLIGFVLFAIFALVKKLVSHCFRK
jgi:glycopeptide antibiotics resistance protein